MRHAGRLLSVEDQIAGSVAVADAAVGATVLLLEDVDGFEELGGSATVQHLADGTIESIEYDGVDDATGALLITAGLAVEVLTDDVVHLYPTITERYATVAVDDASGVPVVAYVPHALRPLVPEGVREEDQQLAVVVEGGDDGPSLEWRVADVRGAEPVFSFGGNPTMRETGTPRVIMRGGGNVVNSAEDTLQAFGITFEDTDDFYAGGIITVRFTGQWDVRNGQRWLGDSTGFRRIWAETSEDDGATWDDARDLGLGDDRNAVAGAPTQQGFAASVQLEEGMLLRFMCRQNRGSALEVSSRTVSLVYLGP